MSLLFKASEQARRACEFARNGNIQCSINILTTLDAVYDFEQILGDFLPESPFLIQMQGLRDQIFELS